MRRCAGLLAVLLGSLLAGPAIAAEPITIGVQLPLGGARAPVGRLVRSAVEMAVEEVNGRGGIRGAPLAAVWEDSGASAESAVAAARRLVDEHHVVAIVGELFSPFALATRTLVEQAGVPYLIGGTNPRTTEGARWVYRVAASDTFLASLIARYAVDDRRFTRLALLSSKVGVHHARAELVAHALRQRGIAPVVRDTWQPDDRDFAPQLQKVTAAGAEAIIALGETGEGAPFLAQAAALPGRPPVIAHRDFGARSVLAAVGAAAEGVRIVTEYFPALADPERQAWARAFEQRTGAEAGIIPAQHYDAVLMLAEAIRRAGPTRAGIREGLEALRGFRGVMTDYTFDERHDGVHRLLVIAIGEGRPALEAVLAD
jgi:branched-chain amino acid transport system substrate-binding protein